MECGVFLLGKLMWKNRISEDLALGPQLLALEYLAMDVALAF